MKGIVITIAIALSAGVAVAQTASPDPYLDGAAAYRQWLAASGSSTIDIQGSTPEATERLIAALAASAAPTTTRAFARAAIASGDVAPTSIQFPLPLITIPAASAHWNWPLPGYSIALDDQLRVALDTADRWATGANALCACPHRGDGGTGPLVGGYDWLKGNAAAYDDWLKHADGRDPVVYFCEQGYDSPLARFSMRFTFNRNAADLNAGLTEASVQYNGVNYPAMILPSDCLAGCGVYVNNLPCVRELQVTIIKLRRPGDEHPTKCIFLRSGVGGEMEKGAGCETQP